MFLQMTFVVVITLFMRASKWSHMKSFSVQVSDVFAGNRSPTDTKLCNFEIRDQLALFKTEAQLRYKHYYDRAL